MPMTFARLAVPCCGAFLLLVACEEEAAEGPRESEQGGKAAGEVLGGTISDDMLPLERLRSQSPSLEGEDREGDDEAVSEDEAESEADAEVGAVEAEDTAAPPPAPSPASTGLPVAPPVDD